MMTDRISRMTPEQEERLPAYRAEWHAVGMCTAPADRATAERAITAMYREVGETEPKFVWADSPLTAHLIMHMIDSGASSCLSLENGLRDSLQTSLRDSLRDSLLDSLRVSLWTSLGVSLWDSLRDSLRNSLQNSLCDSLRNSVKTPLQASLRTSLWNSLRISLEYSLDVSIEDSFDASLEGSLWTLLGDTLGTTIRNSLKTSLEDSLRILLKDSLVTHRHTYWWGQQDAHWIAYYLWCAEIGAVYDPDASRRLALHADVARSCMWWWPYRGLCVVSERPSVVKMDDQGRIHAEDGPAVAFRDGWSVWAWHGVRVPQRVIEQPETLTVTKALAEQNAEVRRVMMTRIGPERIAAEGGMTVVDEIDDDAVEVAHGRDGLPVPVGLRGAKLHRLKAAIPLQWISMNNSTPEPDGSVKRYWLRVPPTMTTAREAMAWTFGLEADAYQPQHES